MTEGDSPVRKPIFTPRFLAHIADLAETDPRLAERLDRLVEEILRTPFSGTGKPELLRYKWKGHWSRRLTQEHRIVYRVTRTTVEFVSARGHYD